MSAFVHVILALWAAAFAFYGVVGYTTWPRRRLPSAVEQARSIVWDYAMRERVMR